MAQDFTKLVNCWVRTPASQEGPLSGALLRLDSTAPMEHATAPTKQETDYDLDQPNVAPHGSTVYNAKVMLTPGVTAADKAALLKGPAAEGGEHLSRLLKFVVARADRNGSKSGIFCLGGRCDPAVDGDPAEGDTALVAAAVRHVRAQVGLDLGPAAAAGFTRFLEVHYTRLDRNDVEHHQEVTVIFLADASRCVPSEADWPAVWERQKVVLVEKAAADRAAKAEKAKAESGKGGEEAKEEQKEGEATPVPEPPMPARPQLQLVGLHTPHLKLKTAAISLDGLLDYNTSDKDEGTFELSVFAEALHEALLRDAGAAIVAELYAHRDALIQRREERKRKRDAADKASAEKKAKTEGGAASDGDAKAEREGAEGGASPAPADGRKGEAVAGGAARPRVLGKEGLALAFRLLDKTGAGYIRTDDLRRLLDLLGLALHHSVAKELCLNVSDTSGRHKNERVHYIPLCEVEADAAAAEQPVHQPAGTDGVKQEPAGDAAMAEAAAADAETPAAGDVKMEDGAEPAAAGTPDADARSAPADEDAAPATEPAAAAEHEGGSEEAPAPASTPERAALAAEVEGLDIPALAEAGKLASLTVAQLTKYLSLHGLPTGGKKAEVVARVAEHVQQA